MHTGSQEVQPMAPVPVPVQKSPSQQIHKRLLNLRDNLDQVSAQITEKLTLVMDDTPSLCEDPTKETISSLPPLFTQYDELIGHIDLVVRDINSKLDSVDI